MPRATLRIAVLVCVEVLVQLELRFPTLAVTSKYASLWSTYPFAIFWHGFGGTANVFELTLEAAASEHSFLMAALQLVPDGSRRVAGFTDGFFGLALAVCAYRTDVAILSGICGEIERQLLLFVQVQGTVLKAGRYCIFSEQSNDSIVVCCVKSKVPNHKAFQALGMLILEFFLERLCIVE
jgi:hypothetical protein